MLSGLRPSLLDTGPRPLTEAAIGFQRQRPEMAHQRTLVRGSENHWGRPKIRRAQIEIAEQRVAEVLDSELARRLQTIPGVGPALAATFIAEIGDIWRFEDFDQLASYAGVHPKELSSGTKGQKPEPVS